MMSGEQPNITSIRQLKNGLFFNMGSTITSIIAIGSPCVLLLTELGASPVQVGLSYSFFFLLAPMQIVSASLLPYFGFRRQMVRLWSLRGVMLVVPVGVSLYANIELMPWMVYAVLAAIFFCALFTSMGSCVYSIWFLTLLPDRLRGRYFSTDTFLVGIMGLLTLLVCSAINKAMDSHSLLALGLQFFIAGVAVIISVHHARRIPDAVPPKPVPFRSMLSRAAKLVLSPGRYRSFLIIWAISAFVSTSFTPFSIYYLKADSSLSDSWIMICTSQQYVGLLLTSMIVRTLVDRFSVKPFFVLAMLGNVSIYLLWIALFAGWLPVKLIGLSFFVAGFAGGNWGGALMKYLAQLSSEEDRPISISVMVAIINFISGIAPIIWGYFVRGGTDVPTIDPTCLLLYFVIAAAAHAFVIPKFMKVVEVGTNVEPFYLPEWTSRPFRSIANLFYLTLTFPRRPGNSSNDKKSDS